MPKRRRQWRWFSLVLSLTLAIVDRTPTAFGQARVDSQRHDLHKVGSGICFWRPLANGKNVVLIGRSGSVSLLTPVSGEIRSVNKAEDNLENSFNGRVICSVLSGSHLVAGDDLGDLHLWDLTSGKYRRIHLSVGAITGVAWANRLTLVVTTDRGECLLLSASGDQLASLSIGVGISCQVPDVGSNRVFLGTLEGDIVTLSTIFDHRQSKLVETARRRLYRSPVTSLDMAPASELLAASAAGEDSCVSLLRTRDLHEVIRKLGHVGRRRLTEFRLVSNDVPGLERGIARVQFLGPNGAILSTIGFDRTCCIWESSTMTAIGEFCLPNCDFRHIYLTEMPLSLWGLVDESTLVRLPLVSTAERPEVQDLKSKNECMKALCGIASIRTVTACERLINTEWRTPTEVAVRQLTYVPERADILLNVNRLDQPDFTAREDATNWLMENADVCVSVLNEKWNDLKLEGRRRAAQVLAALPKEGSGSPRDLQICRALFVWNQTKTLSPEIARRLIEALHSLELQRHMSARYVTETPKEK